jgi:acyl dehydratase
MSAQLDLTPGAALPPFVRLTGFANWNRFAAVQDEFVPIHMDDEAGRAAGFPTAIGMGNLQRSYYHNLLRDWLAGRGRIDQVSVAYAQPNLKDTTLSVQGKIADVAAGPDGTKVTIDLWVEDNNDRKLSSGRAVVTVTQP